MAFTFSSTAGTSGETIINITATANNTLESLIDNYMISNASGYSVPLPITQKANKPVEKYFLLSPSAFTFDKKGGNATINVQSNDRWVVVSNGWIELSNNYFSIEEKETERRRGELVPVDEKYNVISGDGNTIIGIKCLENTGTTRNGFISGHCLSNGATAITASTTVEQEGGYEKPYLYFDKKEVFVTAASSSYTLTVHSNVKWEIFEEAKWFSFGTAAGSGTTDIRLIVDENDTEFDRKDMIVLINREYKIEAQLIIYQSAKEDYPYIKVSPHEFNVDATGSTNNEISVWSNVEFRVEADAGWIHLNSTTGNGNTTIYFSTDANTKSDDENGTILIYNEEHGLYDRVDVRRNKVEYFISASTSVIEASALNEQSYLVSVFSNTNWGINIDWDDNRAWFTVNPINGQGNGSFGVSTMGDGEEKTAYLHIYNNKYGVSWNITVHQS